MKKTIAILAITASSMLGDVVIPLDQWNAMDQGERQAILNQVNANNLAEQNRILERQTAIMEESLRRQQEILDQQENTFQFKPGF